MDQQEIDHAHAGIARHELEIAIDAPLDRVWTALVEETSFWWREDFYATAAPHRFVIEPWLGGRVFEDAGDGDGVIWYTVQGVRRGRSLNLMGHVYPAYGGPTTTLLSLSLEPDGDGTRFRVQEGLLGAVAGADGIRDGWGMLFAELKRHCEAPQ